MLPFKEKLIEGRDRGGREARSVVRQGAPDEEAGKAGEEGRRPMTDVNVALIGYAFMGKAHSNAYRQVAPFFSPRLHAAA